MTLAIVPAPALGDGVLALTLAQSAAKSGIEVVVHHDALGELSTWIPHARVAPRAEAEQGVAASTAAFLADPSFEASTPPPRCVVFTKDDWLRDRPYLESLRRATQEPLQLTHWDGGPGLVRPDALPALTPAPVALHPTSGDPAKNWPVARWLALAERLTARHWHPEFLVAPGEEASWRAQLGTAYPLRVPGPLGAVAAYLARCRGCIATDSGIAHLASAVGTPTVAIFRKPSSAVFWGPAWGRRGAVTAPWRLPGSTGHRLWRTLLRPGRVLQLFEAIVLRA